MSGNSTKDQKDLKQCEVIVAPMGEVGAAEKKINPRSDPLYQLIDSDILESVHKMEKLREDE